MPDKSETTIVHTAWAIEREGAAAAEVLAEAAEFLAAIDRGAVSSLDFKDSRRLPQDAREPASHG